MALTAEEKAKIRAKIEQKLSSLADDITHLKEATKPISPENAIGRISRMDAINNKSVNEAALRSAQDRVVKLNRALREIDEEHFGLCTKCGGPIEFGRLMIMPEGRVCMKCLRG